MFSLGDAPAKPPPLCPSCHPLQPFHVIFLLFCCFVFFLLFPRFPRVFPVPAAHRARLQRAPGWDPRWPGRDPGVAPGRAGGRVRVPLQLSAPGQPPLPLAAPPGERPGPGTPLPAPGARQEPPRGPGAEPPPVPAAGGPQSRGRAGTPPPSPAPSPRGPPQIQRGRRGAPAAPAPRAAPALGARPAAPRHSRRSRRPRSGAEDGARTPLPHLPPRRHRPWPGGQCPGKGVSPGPSSPSSSLSCSSSSSGVGSLLLFLTASHAPLGSAAASFPGVTSLAPERFLLLLLPLPRYACPVLPRKRLLCSSSSQLPRIGMCRGRRLPAQCCSFLFSSSSEAAPLLLFLTSAGSMLPSWCCIRGSRVSSPFSLSPSSRPLPRGPGASPRCSCGNSGG